MLLNINNICLPFKEIVELLNLFMQKYQQTFQIFILTTKRKEKKNLQQFLANLLGINTPRNLGCLHIFVFYKQRFGLIVFFFVSKYEFPVNSCLPNKCAAHGIHNSLISFSFKKYNFVFNK